RFGEDELTVPADRLVELADGTYRLEEPAEARAGGVVERESVPLVTEEVEVGKRERHTRVQVHKTTETRTERIEVPLHHTMFEVKRIPVDRVLTEPVGTRNEGGTTIIPVMEERVVVSKELVLVEEIH